MYWTHFQFKRISLIVVKVNICLLVVECKYRKAPFSVALLEQLKESVSIFGGYTTIDYYLFSKSGFTPEIMKLSDSSLHFISLDSMFS